MRGVQDCLLHLLQAVGEPMDFILEGLEGDNDVSLSIDPDFVGLLSEDVLVLVKAAHCARVRRWLVSVRANCWWRVAGSCVSSGCRGRS